MRRHSGTSKAIALPAMLLASIFLVFAAQAGKVADDPSLDLDSSIDGDEAEGWPRAMPDTPPLRTAHAGEPTTSCLPDRLKKRMAQIEDRWGQVEIISTHRPGARVRGTGSPSRHANCQAVDFRPRSDTYQAVARWLREEHGGGVGTYSSGHIHIDTGPQYRWHNE